MSKDILPGAPDWIQDDVPSRFWLLFPLCVGLGVVGVVLLAMFPEQVLLIFGGGK